MCLSIVWTPYNTINTVINYPRPRSKWIHQRKKMWLTNQRTRPELVITHNTSTDICSKKKDGLQDLKMTNDNHFLDILLFFLFSFLIYNFQKKTDSFGIAWEWICLSDIPLISIWNQKLIYNTFKGRSERWKNKFVFIIQPHDDPLNLPWF